MKFISVLMIVCVIAVGAGRSQSLQLSFPDTIVYGPAQDSTTLSCWNNDFVTNLLNQPLVVDVVRVLDDTACPGWRSAYCFQFCSLPEIDSTRVTMGPKEAVNMAVHFMVTSQPDSGIVRMKIKNVNTPSEVYYQNFYAITQASSGINQAGQDLSIQIFPQPAISSEPVTIRVGGGADAEMILLDVLGRPTGNVHHLRSGEQSIRLGLPSGLYTYRLINDLGIQSTGKVLVL